MEKLFFPTSILVSLFLFFLTISCANSARLLNEVTSENPLPSIPDDASDPVDADVPLVAPVAAPPVAFPSGQIPATPGEAANTETMPVSSVVPPVATSVQPPTGKSATGSLAPGEANGDHATLSFFMHDVLGGSRPSGRVVTGVIATTSANNLPFSKANSQVFPINGGVPLDSINGIINNNNFPVFAGLNGQQTNIQNNGNNNVLNSGGNQPFVTAGQLPSGLSLQELMFGSITVVDNEVTEGHELGTAVIGRAQGFYVASSQDGSSHTLALTTLFHGGEHQEHGVEDTISFFGVHRTAIPISHLAVIGGTGRYENAKGHATIETELHQDDQHITDGVETITHFTVYITP